MIATPTRVGISEHYVEIRTRDKTFFGRPKYVLQGSRVMTGVRSNRSVRGSPTALGPAFPGMSQARDSEELRMRLFPPTSVLSIQRPERNLSRFQGIAPQAGRPDAHYSRFFPPSLGPVSCPIGATRSFKGQSNQFQGSRLALPSRRPGNSDHPVRSGGDDSVKKTPLIQSAQQQPAIPLFIGS